MPDYIETDRLILRGPKESDVDAIIEAKNESRAELAPWFFWAQKDEDFGYDPAIEFLRRSIAKRTLREDFLFFAFEKETDRFLISTGIHPRNWDIGRFEIGYWLRTSQTGKGYVTESTNALTQFAFDYFDAKSVVIRADARNEKSQNVAKRLGYEYEGTLRASEPDAADKTKSRDLVYFSRLNNENLPKLNMKIVM